MIAIIFVAFLFIMAFLRDQGQDAGSAFFLGIIILMVVLWVISQIGSCSSSNSDNLTYEEHQKIFKYEQNHMRQRMQQN